MSDFELRAAYVFKRARLLIGNGTFILFPGSLIAIGKLYPKLGPVANDNEAKE
jgi:hypothetical protein